MSLTPNFDAHITGGQHHSIEVEVVCPEGHKWLAPGESEYGAAWYDDRALVCPADDCDTYAIDPDDPEGGFEGTPSANGDKPYDGYVYDADEELWLIPEVEEGPMGMEPGDPGFMAAMREEEAIALAAMEAN
jgi:hypothetical protein